MQVYNHNIDNERKLSSNEFRKILNFGDASEYNLNDLKDLSEFDFYSLLTIKDDLEKK